MKTPPHTREFILELATLAGEDQARIIKMLILLSRVSSDAEVRAWDMIFTLSAKQPTDQGELADEIDRINAYLEARAEEPPQESSFREIRKELKHAPGSAGE